MHKGDTLIVTELSRLSRTLTDIMAIVGELLERQVHLYSTKDHYAFDDTINSKVLCFANTEWLELRSCDFEKPVSVHSKKEH